MPRLTDTEESNVLFNLQQMLRTAGGHLLAQNEHNHQRFMQALEQAQHDYEERAKLTQGGGAGEPEQSVESLINEAQNVVTVFQLLAPEDALLRLRIVTAKVIDRLRHDDIEIFDLCMRLRAAESGEETERRRAEAAEAHVQKLLELLEQGIALVTGDQP